jgi:hypothetical protein
MLEEMASQGIPTAQGGGPLTPLLSLVWGKPCGCNSLEIEEAKTMTVVRDQGEVFKEGDIFPPPTTIGRSYPCCH